MCRENTKDNICGVEVRSYFETDADGATTRTLKKGAHLHLCRLTKGRMVTYMISTKIDKLFVKFLDEVEAGTSIPAYGDHSAIWPAYTEEIDERMGHMWKAAWLDERELDIFKPTLIHLVLTCARVTRANKEECRKLFNEQEWAKSEENIPLAYDWVKKKKLERAGK